MMRLAGLVVLLAILMSCGSADTGTAVLLRNGTDSTLRVREIGINSGADIVTELQPAAERKSLRRFSTGSTITVKAEDLGGRLVFCHSYTFEEVRRQDGEISVTRGRLDCR